LLDEFATDTYNGLKVTDACCLCGGGSPPSLLPDHLFEWKVAVYGHQNFKNFFSSNSDRENIEFGRGGLRAKAITQRLKANQIESFSDTKPFTQGDLCGSIADIICRLITLKGLCSAITQTGLINALSELEVSEWTLFAPTNVAIESSNLDALISEAGDDRYDHKKMLLYHFVFGKKLYTTDLSCNGAVTMSSDDDSETICKNDVPFYQKGLGNTIDNYPTILESDIETCNGGVIHLVDNLLLLSVA